MMKDGETQKSIRNVRMIKIVCATVTAAILFKNANFLYLILVAVTFKIIILLAHWAGFFSRDPYVQKALTEFRHHHDQVTRELDRAKNGGFLGRQQERIIGGVSLNTVYYFQEAVQWYLEGNVDTIYERVRKESKAHAALYSDAN